MRFNADRLAELRGDMLAQLYNEQYAKLLLTYATNEYLPYRNDQSREARLAEDQRHLAEMRLGLSDENTTRLAYRAAKSLPEYDLSAEDLPKWGWTSPEENQGMIFWSTEPGSREYVRFRDGGEDIYDLVAISWFTMPWFDVDTRQWSDGIHISCYTDREQVIASLSQASVEAYEQKVHPAYLDAKARAKLRTIMAPVTLALKRELWVPFGHGMPGMADIGTIGLSGPETDAGRAMALLKTTWLLMEQQGMCDVEEVAPHRNSAKRLARDRRPVDAVRLIRLRPSEGAADRGENDATGRHVGCRFVVNGHWRRIDDKDNPGRKRQVWVRGHIKGPEGAPFKTGEKVYA